MLDIVIANGTLLGDARNGGPPSSVGIHEGLIVHLGCDPPEARVRIDASGRHVGPGFIDIHTHTDFTLPVRPQAEAKLRQGVTTDVTGNCGFSPFPLESSAEARRLGAFLEPKLHRRWRTLGDYRSDLEASGLAINVAPLVGLGTVRLSVIGAENRPAAKNQIKLMQARVADCMREGCFGASSGLVYAPSSFADQEELVALARTVAEFGGVYATHMRNEGPGLLESVDSAIDIGRQTGVSVQISHLKALGRQSWGMVGAALERIDAAVDEGLDIWFDVYPYTACSSTLGSLLPAAAFSDGVAGLRRRRADPELRHDLLAHLEAGEISALEDVRLAEIPGSPELDGVRLVEYAEEQKMSAAELCLSLLETHGTNIVMVADAMSDGDLKAALTHERAIFGSDGWNLSIDGLGYAHPRNFGSTIVLLQHYVFERAALTIDEAIELLSVRPAARLGLADRGRIAVGAVADVVILDLDRMSVVGSMADPCRYPLGVTDVFVGGAHTLADGALAATRNGRVISKTRAFGS